jgi:hypothetical protein
VTDRIAPALSAEEWAKWREASDGSAFIEGQAVFVEDDGVGFANMDPVGVHITTAHLPTLIALVNHVLPEDDPRKITREKLVELAGAVSVAERDGVYDKEFRPVREFLDALASYLPPDEAPPAG